MYRIIFLHIVFALCLRSAAIAQDHSPAVGWFFAPEYSAMLHGDHLGHAPGFQAGIRVLQSRLHIGFFYYGRSGPINGQTFPLPLAAGQTYKGQTELLVRADQGVFGLLVAPQFGLGENWTLDIPLMVGQMGAGYYLFGDNRNTPDGRRVSVWENELMNGVDAGFSLHVEGGVRIKRRIAESAEVYMGLHYAVAPGWETFVGGTDFYNVPRISLGVVFGP